MPLPPRAEELERNLYRSPLGYEATLRWLERRLARKRVKFRTVVDLPEVVAAHAKSPSDQSRWSGINVSRYDGSVKIFVIERRPSP